MWLEVDLLLVSTFKVGFDVVDRSLGGNRLEALLRAAVLGKKFRSITSKECGIRIYKTPESSRYVKQKNVGVGSRVSTE